MTVRQRVDPRTGEVVEDPQIRRFADWLAERHGGTDHDRVSAALWDVVHAVEELHAAGSVTIRIGVEPMKNDPDQICTTVDVVGKPPRPKPRPAVGYVDHDGNLTRNNPDQPELTGLRVVADEDQSTRRVRKA
jgi:hypothetical protein